MQLESVAPPVPISAPAVRQRAVRWATRLLPGGGTVPDDVRARRHRGILTLLWLHVPALVVFALVMGESLLHGLVEGGIVALPALAALALRRRRREATMAAAVGLLTASAVLVHLSGGMVEAHFHFFVMVGIIVLYEDWAPFLVAIAFVVLHHGVVGGLAPEEVFNHPGAIAHPWRWAGIHGFFVVGMSLASISAWRLNETLRIDALDDAQQLDEAQRLARLGSWEWDVATEELSWSDELFHRLGLRPGEITPTYPAFLARVHPEDRDAMDRTVRETLERRGTFSTDVRVVLPDGDTRWLHCRGEVVTGKGDGRLRLRGTAHDITERRHIEDALRRSEERFRHIIETAQEGVWTLDAEAKTTFVNARMAAILGCRPEGMIGRALLDYVPDGGHDAAHRHLVAWQPGVGTRFDLQFRRADGETVWALVSTTRFTDDQGAFAGTLAMVSDITDRKRAEQQLAHQALHDPLTGLSNRVLLLDRLQQALARSRRSESPLGVLFLDLDRFKVVNDTLGHGAGDDLLVEVAARLQAAVRALDTVARFGGDEFAVLCEGLVNDEEARIVAERIAAVVAAPYTVGGREMTVTASIGIAIVNATDAGIDPESVLRDADAAMYRAKDRGGDRHEVFDGALRERLLQRLGIEEGLRNAVERGELRLYYQPEMSLRNGETTGVEALLRWEHPERGLLAPGEFLPVADETGLIVPIGQWVLTEACRQLRAWSAAHPQLGSMIMWVNLSTRQLTQPDVVDVVASVLAETGVDPRCLGIEITESTFMDVDTVGPVLADLKALGVQLAVDDFGTGFSSMNYLKKFPVDVLKVDRSFVAGLGRDAGDSAIVAAVIGLAHSLGLAAIAEGVETYEHLAALHSLGCDRAQGFYFSRPVPASVMEAQLVGAHSGSRVLVCDDDPMLRRAFEEAGAWVAGG